MKRFIELKDYIPMVLTANDFPADFNWDKLQPYCNILEPLKMVTMDLQNMNADAEVAIRVIKYLLYLSSLIPAMNSPIFALTVAQTSSHYDRFAISVPSRSLLLFDLA